VPDVLAAELDPALMHQRLFVVSPDVVHGDQWTHGDADAAARSPVRAAGGADADTTPRSSSSRWSDPRRSGDGAVLWSAHRRAPLRPPRRWRSGRHEIAAGHKAAEELVGPWGEEAGVVIHGTDDVRVLSISGHRSPACVRSTAS
jgi:hypothetical protein